MSIESDAIPRPGTGFRAKRRKVPLRERLAKLKPGEHVTVGCGSGTIRNQRHHAYQVARALGFRIATRRWSPRTLRVYRRSDEAIQEGAE